MGNVSLNPRLVLRTKPGDNVQVCGEYPTDSRPWLLFLPPAPSFPIIAIKSGCKQVVDGVIRGLDRTVNRECPCNHEIQA